jgi:hypothetical protein
MWKNVVSQTGHRRQYNMAHALCTLEYWGYTHTPRICNSLRDVTATVVTRTRLNVKLCRYRLPPPLLCEVSSYSRDNSTYRTFQWFMFSSHHRWPPCFVTEISIRGSSIFHTNLYCLNACRVLILHNAIHSLGNIYADVKQVWINHRPGGSGSASTNRLLTPCSHYFLE